MLDNIKDNLSNSNDNDNINLPINSNINNTITINNFESKNSLVKQQNKSSKVKFLTQKFNFTKLSSKKTQSDIFEQQQSLKEKTNTQKSLLFLTEQKEKKEDNLFANKNSFLSKSITNNSNLSEYQDMNNPFNEIDNIDNNSLNNSFEYIENEKKSQLSKSPLAYKSGIKHKSSILKDHISKDKYLQSSLQKIRNNIIQHSLNMSLLKNKTKSSARFINKSIFRQLGDIKFKLLDHDDYGDFISNSKSMNKSKLSKESLQTKRKNTQSKKSEFLQEFSDYSSSDHLDELEKRALKVIYEQQAHEENSKDNIDLN